MKRLLSLILLVLSASIYCQAQAEEDPFPRAVVNQGYGEFNFGAAMIRGDLDAPFPGLSLLIGNKTYFENNMIFDAQIGLAFPAILTGKLGVGFKTTNSEFIVGWRPWPMHFYVQTQVHTTKKGGWIMSVEVSPYTFNRTYGETAEQVSFQSVGMLNFGYQWNIK